MNSRPSSPFKVSFACVLPGGASAQRTSTLKAWSLSTVPSAGLTVSQGALMAAL